MGLKRFIQPFTRLLLSRSLCIHTALINADRMIPYLVSGLLSAATSLREVIVLHPLLDLCVVRVELVDELRAINVEKDPALVVCPGKSLEGVKRD